MHKPVCEVLDGQRQPVPPVWLMRQAGRYLPEYRAVRGRVSDFLELCFTPRLAAEVTLQPIRRFGFDAAILFSDILVVAHALGRTVRFAAGEGPQLDPINNPETIGEMRKGVDNAILSPVYEAIGLVKDALPAGVALLGFCGAPWTVATYMVAGQSTVDQAPARLFAYRHPQAFGELIDILVEASSQYLVHQFEAGVDAVQIFDTWAGVLPPAEFDRWCLAPTQRIVEAVRRARPDARIIGFPRGATVHLARFVGEVGVNAVSLDWTAPLEFVRERIQPQRPVQGNLDPVALRAGGAALDRSVEAVLEALADGPFIFNLGHGILPDTPIAHVEQMLKRVRSHGR